MVKVFMRKPNISLRCVSLCVALALTGCNESNTGANPQAAMAGNAPKVSVVTMEPQSIQLSSALPGRTSAYKIAEVRPQVSGIILHRFFTEGSDVKEGDVLYQIDPATYKAAVNSAVAEVNKAKADASSAYKTEQRYADLVKRKLISQQDFDTAYSKWQQAKAQVGVAQANLDNAKIQLSYTKVKAPISGRIGLSEVTEGALVTANQANYLTTIQQLDPIYVDMTQSSTQMIKLKRGMANKLDDNGKLPVTVKLEDGSVYGHKGKLAFSGVTVDESTGSVTLRAIVPNPDNELLPGMFVRTQLPQPMAQTSLLVPQQSVERDQQGKAFVYVVNPQNQVERRAINVGQSIKSDWLVLSGLNAGDQVISRGLMRIKPGMKVAIMADDTQAATTQISAPSQAKVNHG